MPQSSHDDEGFANGIHLAIKKGRPDVVRDFLKRAKGSALKQAGPYFISEAETVQRKLSSKKRKNKDSGKR